MGSIARESVEGLKRNSFALSSLHRQLILSQKTQKEERDQEVEPVEVSNVEIQVQKIPSSTPSNCNVYSIPEQLKSDLEEETVTDKEQHSSQDDTIISEDYEVAQE